MATVTNQATDWDSHNGKSDWPQSCKLSPGSALFTVLHAVMKSCLMPPDQRGMLPSTSMSLMTLHFQINLFYLCILSSVLPCYDYPGNGRFLLIFF